MATLVNVLTDQPEQIVLVLDDYHVIEAQPIHNALALLLDRLPPQLRLVIASRSERLCHSRACAPAVSSPSCVPPS